MSSIDIPGYSIVRELGKGGMATVYLAIQKNFEREVALKVMADGLMENPAFSQRFLQEARIVSRLMHPNIVTVHDVGVHQGHHYLSMQYIDGDDLVAAQRYLNGAQIKQVIVDIAHALAYAGGKGYVHRDVKPENIMLHRDTGRALLMDFGIARTLDAASSMTMTGTALGTPYYMSPEQARGKPVDARTDLYSLGVVAYFLLMGEVPYNAETPVAIGIKHITEPTPTLPAALAALQPLFDKMLAKEPAARFQSGQELAAQWQQLDNAILDTWLKQRPSAPQKPDLSAVTPARGAQAIAHTPLTGVELDDGTDYDQATTVMPSVDNALRADATDRVAAHKVKRTAFLPWVLVVGLVSGGYLYYANTVSPNQRPPAQPETPVVANTPAAELVEPAALPVASESPVMSEPSASETLITDAAAGSADLDVVADDDKTSNLEFSTAARPESGETSISAELEVIDTGFALAEPSANNVFSTNEEPSAQIGLLAAEATSPEPALTEPPSTEPSPTDFALTAAEQAQQQAPLTPEAQAQVMGLYRDVLALAPDHAEARSAVSALLTRFLQGAEAALASGDLGLAKQWLSVWPQDLAEPADNTAHQLLAQRLADAEAIASYLQQAEQAVSEQRYSVPFEGSALASYQAVLSLDADNEQAQQGLNALARHYVTQAQRLQGQEQFNAALQQVAQGLRVKPGQQQLIALESTLQQQLKEQQQLAVLAAKAVQAARNGNAYSGAESAAAYYLAMLQIRPNEAAAKTGLAQLDAQLVANIEQLLLSHEFDRAEAALAPALEQMPSNQQYQRLAQTIADTKPAVSVLRVSETSIDETADEVGGSLVAGRTLYFVLQFDNFYQPTTVLQAQLFDGARSVQIAAVPVIVSGDSGVSRFRIDRPVAGFAEGGYHLDIILAGERITSRAFTLVAAQP